MNLQIEETGPVERRIRIQVPTAEVDAAFDRVYRDLGKGARLKGFRPGKAPRAVLERYFGEQAAREVLQRLVEETLPKAVEEHDLAVVSEPRLQPEGEPRVGLPFSYEATVEIRPEIELKRVRELEVQRPELPEPEQDPVDAHLEELRGTHAQLVAEPEGTLAARGHVVVVDYEGRLEGRSIEGAQGSERELELGLGRAIPGFEEQLLGMAAGQEREFELELPESYPSPEVAARTLQFRVKLHEIKRKELPRLDDEFAKDVSDFDTLDALREDLRARVQKGREAQREQLLREATLQALIDANPFPVPPSLIDRQLHSRLGRAVSELQGRIADEELRRLIESWREEWRPQAERDVRLGLLLPELAQAESIQVSDEDVEAHLREVAGESGESLTRLKRAYKEDGRIEALRASLLERRIVEFLVAHATISDS